MGRGRVRSNPLSASWLATCLALGGAALPWLGCSSGSAGTSGSSSGASSTGGLPAYLDSGVCLDSFCTKDADCCSGFACDTVDNIDSCCELPSAVTLNVGCQLDTDCCPVVNDGGSNLPYCDVSTGRCGIAPNCVPLVNPCTTLTTCCPQSSGQVFCNPVNGPVTASNSGICELQLQSSTSSGGSTGGSTGGDETSGTTGGTGTGDAGPPDAGGGTTGGTGGSGTNYVFTWTFGVNQACEQAGVSWVEIQLSGSTVGLFPCRDPSGTEGATVAAPPLQQQAYTLTGYDAAGDVALAQAAGTAPLADGPTPVPLNLTLDTGGPSNLDLSWTFGGLSCAQAGVSQVQVTLTDPTHTALNVNETAPCSASGHDGLVLSGYGPGQFPLTVSATGSDDGYQATASVASNGLSDSAVQLDLLASSTASSGAVDVHFDFGGESCLAAGLDSVGLQLSTIRGTALVPTVTLGCDAGSDYTFLDVPAPATAFLWVEGIAQGQAQQLANPQVVVSPGGTASYSVVTQLGN